MSFAQIRRLPVGLSSRRAALAGNVADEHTFRQSMPTHFRERRP
jgi:hypothetical protein